MWQDVGRAKTVTITLVKKINYIDPYSFKIGRVNAVLCNVSLYLKQKDDTIGRCWQKLTGLSELESTFYPVISFGVHLTALKVKMYVNKN